MLIDLTSYESNVYGAGDIHGLPSDLASEVAKKDIRNSAIIILGDVGLGFSGNHAGPLKYLNKVGKDRDNHYYFFRGNHDNPESWSDEYKDTYEKKYPNIHYLRDFDELKFFDGSNALIVPGAISVDRKWAISKLVIDKDTGEQRYVNLPRVVGKHYWLDEPIRYSMINGIDKHYDMVLAHTGPTPPTLRSSDSLARIARKYDPALPADIATERKAIDDIIRKTSCRVWVNGHYHVETYTSWGAPDAKFDYNGITVYNAGISEVIRLPFKPVLLEKDEIEQASATEETENKK